MKKMLVVILPFFTACSMISEKSALQKANIQSDGNSYVSFVEDNDLWKEDDINAKSGITKEVFEKVIAAGLKIYKPIATANNESLSIKNNWDDATVNANCSRYFGSVTINMYGGLARREEVNMEGFALVLCHELGHAYGGRPYISDWQKMSAEGQSDYYGTHDCLRKVLPTLWAEEGKEDGFVEAYPETKCAEVFGANSADYAMCLRQLSGSQSLGNLLAAIKQEPVPSFETPDQTVVEETNLSYPATIQCRVDTYHNGTLNMDRPKCWFKD